MSTDDLGSIPSTDLDDVDNQDEEDVVFDVDRAAVVDIPDADDKPA